MHTESASDGNLRGQSAIGGKPTILLATGADSSNPHIIAGIVHFRIGRVPVT
jgi:hypothetical protein